MRKLFRLLVRVAIVSCIVLVYYQSKTLFGNSTPMKNVNQNIKDRKNDSEHILNLHRSKELDENDVDIKKEPEINIIDEPFKKRNDEKVDLLGVINNVPANKEGKRGGNESIKQRPYDETGNNEHIEHKKHSNVTFPPFVEKSPDDGPGEHGKAIVVNLTQPRDEYERLFALNSFNQLASDRMSIHRWLDDTRIQECKDIIYPSNLPMASVIICFHNEAWSVLLRSVHSILDRSPEHMLREIILVDDLSTMDHLKEPLDVYMAKLPKVKIVRAQKREGLIRSRLLGYEQAQGPVLVFLDSHIECFPGWLEPLLARIHEDPKAVPFPVIPIINKMNFATDTSRGSIAIGVFKWDLLIFTWGQMRESEKKRRTKNSEPIRSPTMPGGLFAIDKKWFETLGTYDPDLDHWGGENIELSFKAWMCNGSIETLPCSQVGHIFRANNPIKWPGGSALYRNSMRVAEVWMDHYKETFYAFSFPKAHFGDVSKRRQLRESLHCHDFEWYLDNVMERRPPVILASGEIRSAVSPVCLDTMGRKGGLEGPEGYGCHGKGSSQQWAYTKDMHLMHSPSMSLCYDRKLNYKCAPSLAQWRLDYEKGTIQHERTGLCLALLVSWKLEMQNCNNTKNQIWILPKLLT